MSFINFHTPKKQEWIIAGNVKWHGTNGMKTINQNEPT